RGISEQTESGATVLLVSETEEAGDDLDAVVQRDVRHDHPLAGAVENDHQQGNQKVIRTHHARLCHEDEALALSIVGGDEVAQAGGGSDGAAVSTYYSSPWYKCGSYQGMPSGMP